jgi:peptide/nickel transport system substrate-binding protein
MARVTIHTDPMLSRRAFLATTSGALAGVAACGLVSPAEASKRHPQRGGTLRFATRADAAGLDPHRNIMQLVSHPLAATTQGLLDLDLQSEPVPSIAAEWDITPDLLTYTFKLRKGVLFHNGREVDAEAVKWNFERIQDPKIGHPLTRSALGNLKETQVVDKYTVRCVLQEPSAAFLADVVYYPCNLIAPDSAEQADMHPIGCGPFKLVKWERNSITELIRFENYFETDVEGNSLPYLDGISGRPKKEDQVRLTSLRAGEVDLIDNMAETDAADFATKYAGKFQTWEIPTLATSFIVFNVEKGPFTDKQLRLAAAHAIDHEAIQQAVFYGRGETARGFYAPASPWFVAGAKAWPEYDPDKAKALLRKAKAVGAEVIVQVGTGFPYLQHTAELIQAMWSEIGFKVAVHLHEPTVLNQKRRDRDFHAESTSGSYRWDPDGWFSRQILSSAPNNKINGSGFKNEKADKLIAEARQTADKKQRLELYAAIDSIVNDELPILYIHHLTALQAGAMNLKGYQPAISGPFSTRGGGIRTAWLA